MKRFFHSCIHLLLALMVTITMVGPALAQGSSNAKILMNLDCETLEKKVKLGFVSNETDPENGPEIIAFNIVLNLTALGSTQQTELEAATINKNNAYTNMIVAQSSSKVVDGKQEIKVAGGFTAQNGISNADDLFYIEGLKGKNYRISVGNTELFPKNGTENIYNNGLQQKKDIDPNACGGSNPAPETPSENTTGEHSVLIDDLAFVGGDITIQPGETVVWTNNDDTVHTVTSDGNLGPLISGDIAPGDSFSFTFATEGVFSYTCNYHPTMTGTITVGEGGPQPSSGAVSDATTISFADLEDQQPNASVSVVATVTNRGDASVDWSQTGGAPIQPEISNEETSDTVTTSTLTFTMPPAGDVTLRLTVGTATKTILVNNAAGASAPTAGDTHGSAPDDNTAGTTSDDQLSLQERLQQRREEQQAAAEAAAAAAAAAASVPSGTIHGAAGVGLAQSGPGDTGLLIILSLAAAYGWRKLRKPKVSQL